MRTKRRHELETNVLADWLGRAYGRWRPYANQFAWAVLILLAVVIGGGWLIGQWRQSVREPWTAMGEMLSYPFVAEPDIQAQRYQSIAEAYPGSQAGHWARLMSADMLRQEGAREVVHNRDNGLVSLRSAERQYRQLVEQPTGMELLDERAIMGLAECLEAIGELDEAKRYYRQLLDRHPPERRKVGSELTGEERLDLYLLQQFPDLGAEGIAEAIHAGLVEVPAEEPGQWRTAERYMRVRAGDILRVQLDGLFTLQAQQRLHALEDPEITDFYAWLEEAQPPPSESVGSKPSETSAEESEAGILPPFEAEPASEPSSEPEMGVLPPIEEESETKSGGEEQPASEPSPLPEQKEQSSVENPPPAEHPSAEQENASP